MDELLHKRIEEELKPSEKKAKVLVRLCISACVYYALVTIFDFIKAKRLVSLRVSAENSTGTEMAAGFMLLLSFVAFAFFVLTLVSYLLVIKKKYTIYSIIVSSLMCLYIPIGTFIGVWSICQLSAIRKLQKGFWDSIAYKERQRTVGCDSLLKATKRLSIGYTIIGSLSLFSVFFTWYIVGSRLLADEGFTSRDSYVLECFALVGGLVSGILLSLVMISTGVFIRKKKHYNFVRIVSLILCFFVPIGTIIGIMSLNVLSEPDIKNLFKEDTCCLPD